MYLRVSADGSEQKNRNVTVNKAIRTTVTFVNYNRLHAHIASLRSARYQPLLLYSDDSYQKDRARKQVKKVNVCSHQRSNE